MGEHTKAEHRGVARRMVYIPVHTIDRQLNGPNIGLVRLHYVLIRNYGDCLKMLGND